MTDRQAGEHKSARKLVVEYLSERIENFDPCAPWNAMLVEQATRAAESYAAQRDQEHAHLRAEVRRQQMKELMEAWREKFGAAGDNEYYEWLSEREGQ